MITATSGRYDAGRVASWPASIDDSEPTCATVRRRTLRWVAFASRVASRAPRVSFGSSAPSPAAIESPTTSSSIVAPYFFLYFLSAGSAVLTQRLADQPRATAACRCSSAAPQQGAAATRAAAEVAPVMSVRRTAGSCDTAGG